MVKSEPILDVVRGLSAVASFAIIINQLKDLYRSLYLDTCSHCRGVGTLTCPHCHGTATLLRRPGVVLARSMNVGNSVEEMYACAFCGDSTRFDIPGDREEDNDDQAAKVQANLRAALSNNYPLPHRMPVYSGTVPCTSCLGSGGVKRITPNIGRTLGLEEGWAQDIMRRLGRRYLFQENRPRDRRRLFLEYPRQPQPNAHVPFGEEEKPDVDYAPGIYRQDKDPVLPTHIGPLEIVLTSLPNLEEYILPFVDEEPDSEEEW